MPRVVVVMPRGEMQDRQAVGTSRLHERKRAMPMDESDDDTFNDVSFWRAPVGLPPDQEAQSGPLTTKSVEAIISRPPALDHLLMTQEMPSHGQADKLQQVMPTQEMPSREQADKLSQVLLPKAVEEMTYDELKERLHDFQAQWWARYKRRITPDDERSGLIPAPVLRMYGEIGKRLTPEQLAKDQELKREREAAAAQAAAAAAAEAAALAAKHAEGREARAKEWAEFELNKETAWRAATTEAKDQRIEAAGDEICSNALTGAASWVKVDDQRQSSAPTREEYIRQAMDDFGISVEEDHAALAQEEQKWARARGAKADEAATQERWAQAEAQTHQAVHHARAAETESPTA